MTTKKTYPHQDYSEGFRYKPKSQIKHIIWIGVIAAAVICIWLYGFKFGILETIKMWPEPLQIEHKQEVMNLRDSNYYAPDFASYGVASYYDYELASGWTSYGHYVCASRDFEKGLTLLVTNLNNNKQTTCFTTDYGPDKSIHPDRIIDLSSTAFLAVSNLAIGLFDAKVELLCNYNCVH